MLGVVAAVLVFFSILCRRRRRSRQVTLPSFRLSHNRAVIAYITDLTALGRNLSNISEWAEKTKAISTTSWLKRMLQLGRQTGVQERSN